MPSVCGNLASWQESQNFCGACHRSASGTDCGVDRRDWWTCWTLCSANDTAVLPKQKSLSGTNRKCLILSSQTRTQPTWNSMHSEVDSISVFISFLDHWKRLKQGVSQFKVGTISQTLKSLQHCSRTSFLSMKHLRESVSEYIYLTRSCIE